MHTFDTIAALKEGDTFVFGELFNEYHQKIYLYILSKTHSPYIAEEVTQITFIKLWDYRRNLDETEPVAKLIFRMARTSCIDLLRKESTKARLAKEERPVETYTLHITEGVEVKELQQRMRRAIQNMPPVRRRVFELSRFEFKSHKEIAAILSLSVKTVENHVALAIKQLKNLLALLFLCFFF